MEKHPYIEPETQEKEKLEKEEENLKEKGIRVIDSWAYKLFVKSAYRLINKPLAVFRLLKQVLAHMERYQNVQEFTKDVYEHVSILVRLVQRYAKGEYRGISVKGVALTVGALLYFVAPFDLIPDFFAVGLIDDIALITWVFNNYKDEIEAFLEWEDDKKTRIKLPAENEKT